MASEFAMKLTKAGLDAKDGLIQDALDAGLQEVREVLTQLAEWPFPVGKPCWCRLEGEHSEACQRARDLMEKLKP